MSTSAKDGPRFAPATAEMAEMTTHRGAVRWSTSPASISATP
jgi:hypothetical protein